MTETSRQALVDALPKIRRRIQQLRDRKGIVGEQNTKAALIDPILSALGWELEELDEVSREYKRKPQDKPVDYALFMLRAPRLFVEAKGFDINLNDRKWISQILGYATVVGVEWCVLTNGDEYRLYNSHATVDVEEKLFRTVRISDPSQDEYTLNTLDLLSKGKMGENYLDVLWKAHFIDRHVKATLDNLLRNEDNGLIRLIRKRTPALNPSDIRESLKRANILIDYPIISTPPHSLTLSESNVSISPNTTVSPSDEAKVTKSPQQLNVKVTDLIQAGLIILPLRLERNYKGIKLEATIQPDGKVVFDDNVYDSLSTAAGFARKSVIGAPEDRPYPQTNGWTFWHFYNERTGKLEEIDSLRQLYLQNNS